MGPDREAARARLSWSTDRRSWRTPCRT